MAAAATRIVLSVLAPALLVTPAPGQQPLRLVSPQGHSSPLRSAAFSPDGRLVLTVSDDRSARLWDATTGREIRAWIDSSGDGLNSAVFAPDGRTILAGGGKGQAVIWDVESGAEVGRLAHQTVLGVQQVRFNGDGRVAITRPAGVSVWEVASRRVLHTIDTVPGIRSADLSPDGRFLVLVIGQAFQRRDRYVLRPLAGGEAARDLGIERCGTGGDPRFAPDGLSIAIPCDSTIRVIGLSGQEIARIAPPMSPGAREGFFSVEFSPDSRRLLTAGGDGRARIWDISTGQPVDTLSNPGMPIRRAAFSADARRLVVALWDDARIFDAETGEALQSLRGSVAPVVEALAPGGAEVASAVDDRIIVWETRSGRPQRMLDRAGAQVWRLTYSPDGRRLLAALLDGNLTVWDVANGRQLCTTRFQETNNPLGRVFVMGLAVAPDGGFAAADTRTVTTWNASCARVTSFRPSYFVQGIAFAQNGSTLIVGGSDDSFRSRASVWNARTGRRARELSHGDDIEMRAVLSSPDGNTVATATLFGIRLFDVPGGFAERMLSNYAAQYTALGFSADGRFLAAAAYDSLRVWEVASGRRVHSASSQGARSRTVAFFPDGNRLGLFDYDRSSRVWDLAAGKEVIRRFTVDTANWVVISPDGRFDGTARGISRMHWARGTETLALEAFFERFFTPGLAGLSLPATDSSPPGPRPALPGPRPGTTPPVAPDIRTLMARPPGVRIVSARADSSRPVAAVAIATEDRGGGVRDIRLYHNGAIVSSQVRGGAGTSGCAAGLACYSVQLLPGANTFEATAFADDQTEAERSRVILMYDAPPRKPNLYIVAAGINSYRNPRYSLNYGRRDAAAFVDSVRAGAGGIFERIVIDTLFDTLATRASIGAALRRVAGTARAEDVFVFYYAGHGTVVTSADSARFYLIPSDVVQMTDSTQLAERGLVGGELRSLIEAIPARKKLLVIDACQSGEMLSAFARRGAAEERALALLARASGLFIISATDSDQFATEVRALGHGVFTYGLLQALSADRSRAPRERTVGEILSRATLLIPTLSALHRTQPQYPMLFTFGQDFPLIVR